MHEPEATSFEVRAIGIVRSSRREAVDDGWDAESARIELLDPLDERALIGIEAFSHCVVVYVFHLADPDRWQMSRHPRGNDAWPEVGILAQRAKDRPNRLGVTTCRVLGHDGRVLHVAGLDAVDGTPVLDVKPYLTEFGPRGEVHQPAWASELMQQYW